MKEETFTYTDSENYHLFVYKWSPETSPKAVVQLSHGMTENAERYREFAEALTNEGFIVYGHDHRGHGKSVKEKQMFGYCGEDGFMKCMHNVHDINLYIREHHPELPIFLFAHSFGSFLVQRYITLFNEPLHGVILGLGMGIIRVLARSFKTEDDYMSFFFCLYIAYFDYKMIYYVHGKLNSCSYVCI